MFPSTTTIKELVLNLAKVIFMLKHSAKLRRYMLFGDVAVCHRAACVLCAQHKYNFSQVQYKLPDDGHRPKHVGAIIVCILM